jgi:hypothetical protein
MVGPRCSEYSNELTEEDVDRNSIDRAKHYRGAEINQIEKAQIVFSEESEGRKSHHPKVVRQPGDADQGAGTERSRKQEPQRPPGARTNGIAMRPKLAYSASP